jgi:uncharacterized protein
MCAAPNIIARIQYSRIAGSLSHAVDSPVLDWYCVCTYAGGLKTHPPVLILLFVSISLHACEKEKRIPAHETVQFTSGDALLEGSLDIPAGDGPFPIAVFVHGSGKATRNDYHEFVTPLLKEGMAVFRYDKRGVGSSGGTYINVGTFNSERAFNLLAADAASAIEHLRNNKRIDGDKVVVIGGSQAGWIIPEVTTMTTVWLSICISGPLVSVGEEIFYSDLAEHGPYSQAQADVMLNDFHGEAGYDPVSRIEKMTNPSLWIFGGRDVSIPVKKCIALLGSLKKSKNLPMEMKLYPDADHGLYNSQLQRREDHVTFIIDWIKKR